MDEVKFNVSLPYELRQRIKREARKHNISMNEYIVTILEKFVEIRRGKNEKEVKGNHLL